MVCLQQLIQGCFAALEKRKGTATTPGSLALSVETSSSLQSRNSEKVRYKKVAEAPSSDADHVTAARGTQQSRGRADKPHLGVQRELPRPCHTPVQELRPDSLSKSPSPPRVALGMAHGVTGHLVWGPEK